MDGGSGKGKIGIIGAGPAGLAASLELSRREIPHILFDSDHFPRHKPCGDILTWGVLRQLNQLDPNILTELKAGKFLNPIWQSLTYPPNGKPISIDFLPFEGRSGEPSCFSISRFHLDNFILAKALKSTFLDFRPGSRVKNLHRREAEFQLEFDNQPSENIGFLILATGSEPSLPSRLGIQIPDREIAVGIRAHFEGVNWPKDQAGLFLDKDLMPGGLYVTPLNDSECNVNLVMTRESVKQRRLSLRDALKTYLSSQHLLKERFANARQIGKLEGSSLYLGTGKRALSGHGFLLAGDVAGLIEFFTGNGIPQAFQSGRMAASMAAEAMEKGDVSAAFLRKYDLEIEKKVKKAGPTERMILPLIEKKPVSRFLLGFLNHLSGRPHTNQMLRDMMYRKSISGALINPGFWYKLLVAKR